MHTRTFILGTLVFAVPAPALAGDLGEALGYVETNMGEAHVAGYEDRLEPEVHALLPMIMSRDIEPGKPPEAYDCEHSRVDDKIAFSTSSEEFWALYQCRELIFRRGHAPGYRTLGDRVLSAREVDPWVRRASEETNVPTHMIHAIMRFLSGYRPDAVSDEGHVGLMQLRPDLLEQEGIGFSDLRNPAENILVGARYIKALTVRTDMIHALASYKKGRAALAAADGVPSDPQTIFIVREATRFTWAEARGFPNEIAAESMAFVWNWLD